MDFNFSMETVVSLFVNYGIKVFWAIVLFLFGRWVARKCADLLCGVLERKKVDITLVTFLRNLLYYLLLVAVMVAVLGQLGVSTASFLTILGAASLAVGLALKDSLANFSSGVMLILFRPFRIGDVVEIGGESGVVQEITIFNTILHTADNQKKIIPNGAISNQAMTNVTANPTRRVDITVGIGYEDDIRSAKKVLEKIVTEDERILKDPAPVIAVAELGDSSVNLVCRPWVKTDLYWKVYFDLLEKIKIRFDEAGISIPYPQRDVHVHSEEERQSGNQ